MLAVNISNRFARRKAWLALIALAIVTVALVAVPVFIIRPFTSQSEPGLALSYSLRRWAPLMTLVAFAAGLSLVVGLWRGSQRWVAKALSFVVLIPMLAAVWFSRQNHFEWIFNPLPNASYAKTLDAQFVADSDIVMAVESNEEAAAYPVRLMAYHHLVHDVVGGNPVVATY
jgi:hypothetical protein